ncbi:hypothetical protein EVC45_36410 [Paraburkholderia sp. UYCP14C]|uniref:hypothetical protein n=1 Tax=Paraburkholderia sp. UYCP14C TaxID=2511130 RepID=UPI0010204EC7|nr:hypothetical protein [Paraburkholderia sp. UYCP14C]RZF24893.1 hypothetical protein EVC45_36410 [Paraburkholderia sp. UYCP14C]
MKNFNLSPVSIDSSIGDKHARNDKEGAENRSRSLYRSFLASTASTIASNVPERPDVSSAAVLGYN